MAGGPNEMTDWWDDLVEFWMPSDPNRPNEARRKYYGSKYEVAGRIRPKRIVEIGVRAGYGAFAMLSAVPDAQYMGIDMDAGTHGGIENGLVHAELLLSRFQKTEIWVMDSHDIERLPKDIDLIHIDGDHSFTGCFTDLSLALNSGVHWALVDDVDSLAEVRQAHEAWIKAHPQVRVVEEIHDGLRGSALIELMP